MHIGTLLLPAFLCISGATIAQDFEQPSPFSHPVPETFETPLPEPKREDCPLLSRYGRANQLNYLIEPDIDFGMVGSQVNIGVAPTVGHRIWKGLYAGAGVVFIYSGTKNAPLADVNGQLYSANANNYTYGAGVYIHYTIWKGLYIRARVDLLHRQIDNLNDAQVLANPKTGAWQVNMPVLKMNIPDLPIGVGYNLLVKKKLFLPIQLSYNVLYPFLNKQYSVYPKGWILKVCVVNIF